MTSKCTYLPYCAGVDDCLGIELYIVNNLHSTPFKEVTTAAMLKYQAWKLLITTEPCAPKVSYSFLVSLVSYSFLIGL